MNNKYSHIFFDLDNTLWDFERNSRSAMSETVHFYNSYGKINFDHFFKVYSTINHKLWESYRKKKIGKKELTRKRFLDTFIELSIEGIDPDEMNTRYLQEMPKQKNLNDGVIEMLEYLKSRNYQLYIITNGFKEVQYEKLESSGLMPFFKKVFISELIKTPKPGKEIFEYAIKSANAKKNRSIMIGDDWDVDVMGALNFGIDAIHFDQSINQNLISANNPVNNSTRVFVTGTLRSLKTLF